MAGAERQLNPVASSPGKIAAPSSPSTPPERGFRFLLEASPSFARAMGQVKAVASPLAKFMTLHLRLRKPMPPNGPWLRSADHLGLSFIAKTKTRFLVA